MDPTSGSTVVLFQINGVTSTMLLYYDGGGWCWWLCCCRGQSLATLRRDMTSLLVVRLSHELIYDVNIARCTSSSSPPIRIPERRILWKRTHEYYIWKMPRPRAEKTINKELLPRGESEKCTADPNRKVTAPSGFNSNQTNKQRHKHTHTYSPINQLGMSHRQWIDCENVPRTTATTTATPSKASTYNVDSCDDGVICRRQHDYDDTS